MNSTKTVSPAPFVHAGQTIRRADRRLGVIMLAPALLYIALLVAIPFPLAGTIAGAWILANSGLAGLRWRLLKNRLSGR